MFLALPNTALDEFRFSVLLAKRFGGNPFKFVFERFELWSEGFNVVEWSLDGGVRRCGEGPSIVACLWDG